MKLISRDIPELVADRLGEHMLDATLTRSRATERDPYVTSGGTQPTSTDYAALGFVKSFDDAIFPNTIVSADHVIVVLLGASIEDDAIPEANDRITIEHPPESGVMRTFHVEAVKSDPVGATYKLLAR